tara:strand:+ start:236 stop:451 length:216 start_codon:yes stop_codon:yes gene_type:complete
MAFLIVGNLAELIARGLLLIGHCFLLEKHIVKVIPSVLVDGVYVYIFMAIGLEDCASKSTRGCASDVLSLL